jgi:hypothetical protein
MPETMKDMARLFPICLYRRRWPLVWSVSDACVASSFSSMEGTKADGHALPWEGRSRVHHVEVAEVETAVSFTSPANWLGCCPHSCLFLVTGLEFLLCGHSDGRRAWTPWAWVDIACDDYRQKFTGQLSRGVARSSQSMWVGTMNCRKLGRWLP